MKRINPDVLHMTGGACITALFMLYGTNPFWALGVCGLIGAGYEVNQLRDRLPFRWWKVGEALKDWLFDLAGGVIIIALNLIGGVLW